MSYLKFTVSVTAQVLLGADTFLSAVYNCISTIKGSMFSTCWSTNVSIMASVTMRDIRFSPVGPQEPAWLHL